MSKKRNSEGCETNMTPMIDVVFQLIIFFIVTINLSEAKDEEVQLEFGKHGQEVETSSQADSSAMIIDVGPKGRISTSNMTIDIPRLRHMLKNRYAKFGDSFQVWVRGDYRATHKYVRKIMDACAEENIGRVTFIAIMDARTPASKEHEAYNAAVRSRR